MLLWINRGLCFIILHISIKLLTALLLQGRGAKVPETGCTLVPSTNSKFILIARSQSCSSTPPVPPPRLKKQDEQGWFYSSISETVSLIVSTTRVGHFFPPHLTVT